MTFTVGDCRLAGLLVHGASCSRAGTRLEFRNDIRPRSLQRTAKAPELAWARFGPTWLSDNEPAALDQTPCCTTVAHLISVCGGMLGHACLHNDHLNLGPKASSLLG